MGNLGRNLKSAVIAFLVPLPSLLFYISFLNHFSNKQSQDLNDSLSSSPLWNWCYNHPLLLANAFFFFNVNVLFWVISQIVSSHWVRSFVYFNLLSVLIISLLVVRSDSIFFISDD